MRDPTVVPTLSSEPFKTERASSTGSAFQEVLDAMTTESFEHPPACFGAAGNHTDWLDIRACNVFTGFDGTLLYWEYSDGSVVYRRVTAPAAGTKFEGAIRRLFQLC
jgi:hypothetical protein